MKDYRILVLNAQCGSTINDNDMLSYSVTTMMCFKTKE